MRIVLYLAVLCSMLSVKAIAQAETDSVSTSAVRNFDARIVDDLRKQPEFEYATPPDMRPNFIKRLFMRFFDFLVGLFGQKWIAWIVLTLIGIATVGGLAFALYGIFGTGKTMPVTLSENNNLDYQVTDEDIHATNFSEEIELAANQHDYRKAVRLIYLNALKMLTDEKVVDYQPYKTNFDYKYEIQENNCRELFGQLSYFFEYIWYGNFVAHEQQYHEMKSIFMGLKANLHA